MKKVLLIASVLLAALAVSCKKEVPVEDSLTLKSQSSVTVPVDGDVVSITFNTNVAWTAKASQDWLTLQPSSGEAGDATVKASVMKNEAFDAREAKVTITAGSKTETVTIIQGQTNALQLETTSFDVPADGGTVAIKVKANVNYEVKIPAAIDWITQTKGMTESTVTLNVAASKDTEVRTANITITDGKLSSSVTITQAAFQPYFDYTGDWADLQWSFYGTPTVIPQEGADILIGVDTNIEEWRAYFSVWDNDAGAMVDSWDMGWAHLSYDVAKAEIHLVIDANDTYVERVGHLYAECTINGAVSGEYGGLGQFNQAGKVPEAGLNVLWTKLLSEVNVTPGVNRLAFSEHNGVLLVSDENAVLGINPENGEYMKAHTWSGIKPASIDVDDAGNIILVEDIAADMDWDTGTLLCTEFKIYCTKNENETPKEIVLPNELYGTLGSFRATGDLSTKGSITGIAAGAGYWFGYDIANYEAVPNYYRTQNSGPIAGPNMVWSPVGATAIAYGADLHDGVLYRGYDGYESVYFRADAYTPQWAVGDAYEPWTLCTDAGSGGNENQNNMDIIEYQGRKLLAYTQGTQFSYGGNTNVYVVDVTNPGSATVIASLDGGELASVEAIAEGEEAWPGAYFAANIGADVLIREEEGLGLVIYVVNSTTESLSKLLLVF